jgi:hypothetical protein
MRGSQNGQVENPILLATDELFTVQEKNRNVPLIDERETRDLASL